MRKKYAVVFDMDETLGCFSQLYQFWHFLKLYIDNESLSNKYFYNILDKNPEFLRTNILDILKTVKKKKQKKICDYVFIYTNNNGPNFWANLIQSYFHYKLKYNLFDQIIRGYMVNGKIIEVCRSSDRKSYKDLLNCTKLPINTQVCFIDDVYHDEMDNENVVYIHIKPYRFNIKYSTLCTNFYNNNRELFSNSTKRHYKLEDFIKFMNHNTRHQQLKYLYKTPNAKLWEYQLAKQTIEKINGFLENKKTLTVKTYKKNKKKKKNKKTQKE